jgi:hypothetical protein
LQDLDNVASDAANAHAAAERVTQLEVELAAVKDYARGNGSELKARCGAPLWLWGPHRCCGCGASPRTPSLRPRAPHLPPRPPAPPRRAQEAQQVISRLRADLQEAASQVSSADGTPTAAQAAAQAAHAAAFAAAQSPRILKVTSPRPPHAQAGPGAQPLARPGSGNRELEVARQQVGRWVLGRWGAGGWGLGAEGLGAGLMQLLAVAARRAEVGQLESNGRALQQ